MKTLSKLQIAIFLVGAVLMAVGAGLYVLKISAASYIYCLGALAFASMQLLQRYEGSDFTIRRLRRIMLFSDILFLVSAVLMFAGAGNPMGLDQITYVMYIYNKWVVTLLLAAVLQLYVTHRISHELEKEAKKR
jgi:hypothetical protein